MSSRPSLKPNRPRTDRKSLGKKPGTSVSEPVSGTATLSRNQPAVTNAPSFIQVTKADAAPNQAAKVDVPVSSQVRNTDACDSIQVRKAAVPEPGHVTLFRRGLLYFKSMFSLRERCLILSSASYFLISCVFFALVYRGDEYRGMRLAFTALSVMLDLAIVIAAGNKILKVILVALPTLALALLHQLELNRIEKQQTGMNLIRVYEQDLHDKERHIAEDVLIDPENTVTMGKSVHIGFQIKSKRLQISVSEMEASLLAQHPEMLQLVLSFPDDPAAKLKSYEKLKRVNPFLEMPIEQILQPLRDEVAYSDLANFFRRQINPQYLQLDSALNRNFHPSMTCQRIFKILDTLAQVELNYPLAGLLNHMGTMAMSCGRRYEAMGHFYTALALDPMHLPAYESLAYILWLGNKDERTALEVVEHGLRLCASERSGLEDSFKRTMEAYELIARKAPARALLLRQSAEKLKKRVTKIQKSWGHFIDEMETRLRNDFAYFSALGRWNEQKARSYIAKLYQSNPESADYQDTYGFVKMRFAKNEEELEEADQFFTAAIENQTAGKEETRLASAHKDELERYKSELRGREHPLR